jgi:mannose-6-phosphate isomerase-like protein (cupin superfamily)
VDFIDLVTVPPGCSIGDHDHGDNEERYVILSGSGTMTMDGAGLAVSAGDVLVNRRFGRHGLCNTSAEELRLLVFQVSAPHD